MKNLIIVCIAGTKTNGSLSRTELQNLKKINDDIRKGVLSKYIGENTTIYCGNNEEEDQVLSEALNILNPKQKISVGQKASFIIRKINFLSRRNTGKSAHQQAFFLNKHLKAVYFSKKILQTEIVLMSERGIKKSLTHITSRPEYGCPPEILRKEIPVGTAIKIKMPQKYIEAFFIN